MKHLSFILLYLVSVPLRLLIKIDNNLLLFSARGGIGYEGNAKYLFLYANRNTDFDCVWVSKSRKIVSDLTNEGYIVYYYFSWKAIKLALSAKAVFITHSLSDVMPVFYNKKTLVIDLWHGVPIKRISFLDKNLRFRSRLMDTLKSRRVDFMISNSVEFAKIYSKSFKISEEKIKSFGQPKIEFLQNSKLFISNLENYFPEGKEIILYAPTFRDYEFSNPLFSDEYLTWLNKEMEKLNSLFYIKVHPSEKSPDIKCFDNVKIVDSQSDIYNLYPFISHVISDYSSTFLDFFSGLPDRKVSLFVPDFKEYKLNRNFNFDFTEKFGGLICSDPKLFFKSPHKADDNLINFINPKSNSCEKILRIVGHFNIV
ncbi:CDP-glycerol glycerophosphotransferase family protein [Ancylomarina sp. YFZ004]